jgi:hypothetical protein
MGEQAAIYDIDAILAKVEAKDIIPTLVDAICTRKTRKVFGRELDIVWLDRVHGGIFIDGIYGILGNYGLTVLAFSVKAMERIGAVQRARILREAVDSFGDEAQVRELAKSFTDEMVTPELKKLFWELTSRYYAVSEDYRGLAVTYIKQHIEDFRGYGARD